MNADGWAWQSNAPGGALVVTVMLLVLVAGVLWDLRSIASLPRGRAYALAGLRLCTALVVALCVVQPAWWTRQFKPEDSQLAVLFDQSRSMGVVTDGTTRAQQAQRVVTRLRGQSGASVAWYGFRGGEAEAVDPAALERSYGTTGDQTRLVEAVESVAKLVGDELGAVVLVSDGADTQPQVALGRLRQLGLRVHTVLVGEAAALRDDAIVGVRSDPVAFLRQEAEVEVEVRTTPPRSGTVLVSLHEGSKLVRELPAVLDRNGVGRVTIPFEIGSLGRAVYNVSIPELEGDAVPANNRRAFLVRAKRDRMRVLLVCGRPSWDARFLRAFLKADPSIDLITFFILRTTNDMSMAAPDELSLIPFPTDELFREHLHSFDVVVFQDFNYGPYQMARYLPLVREYVLQGGAFAMLGGDLSFGAGGYLRTPVGEVLPVTIPEGGDALVEGAFSPEPVPGVEGHPLAALRARDGDTRAAWGDLAPLLGANRLGPPVGDAQVILQHPTAKTSLGTPMPVLTVGSAGEGRTLALGSDTSWRWGFTTAGGLGDASAYELFWDRALRWLSRDPSLEPSEVRSDRERYGPGGDLEATLRLRDAGYAPMAGRHVKVAVLNAEGDVVETRPLTTDGRGRGQTTLSAPQEPGAYRLAVLGAEPEGDAPPLAEEGFVVESGGDELANPFAQPETLRAIADATGGTAYSSADAIDLKSLDRGRAQVLTSEQRNPLTTVAFFAIAALCLGSEWLLRRRWGLR